MEENKIERGTRIGESIEFLQTKENLKDPYFIRKLPDIYENACSSCDLAHWQNHSKNGPQCFCPVSHEYTFKWIENILHEQILECSKSRLGPDQSKMEETNKEEKND